MYIYLLMKADHIEPKSVDSLEIESKSCICGSRVDAIRPIALV